jgi:hypothetical protein
MNHLHELSFAAINFDCAVVITNMVRNVPVVRTISDLSDNNVNKVIKTTTTTTSNSYQQREFMGTSVSIYSHIKLRLEIVNSEKSIVRASLMQPSPRGQVSFRIISRGFSDQIK